MTAEGDRGGIMPGDSSERGTYEDYDPTDEELKLDMAAILNAFDLSSPEEQERMLAEIRETGDTILPPGQLKRGIQAANLSMSIGTDRETGMRYSDSLEDAAKHIPGIAGVLGLLSQPLPPREEKP